ncbi:MAG: hypothetical protein ABFC77_11525 [Thermoguttaceae bacterium]
MMHLVGILLGGLLLGQSSDAVLPARNVRENLAPAAALQPTVSTSDGVVRAATTSESSATRRRPPELIAEAMSLPAGSALTGQPLTLLSAVSSTMDRREQLEMVRSYWQLVQAVGDYRFCLDSVKTLESLKSLGEGASLRLAEASSSAMVRRAELAAVAAQCELARRMHLPAGSPLPLPSDRPHVGGYRTNFQELFAGRTPPEPIVLLERVLPIRRQAIDDQAAAVLAAEDVLAAAGEARDPAAVIASNAQLLEQRRTFVSMACQYNREIAQYGLIVASPASSPQALVAMLIGPSQTPVAPFVPNAVRPTAATEPVVAPTQTGTSATKGWRTTESTPATSKSLQSLGKNEPTLAPPREESATWNGPTQVEPKPAIGDLKKNEPTLAPPRNSSSEELDVPVTKPLVPVEQPAKTRTANKPASPSEATAASNSSALYPALQQAAPAARVKQLSIALYWNRSLPEGLGRPMSLADCVGRAAAADRQATIESYWRLRQRTAAYQTLVQQEELLDGLVSMALEHRSTSAGAAEMLRWEASQRAAHAATREAHAALLGAQYDLASHIGMTDDPASWPVATTVPHSGGYALRLDAQPRSVVESWPIRRLATEIPTLGETAQRQAAAVVEADVVRAANVDRYRKASGSIDPLLKDIASQTQQTLALLETLTDYNRAIAEYALTVLPAAVPANRLVGALVIQP